MNLCVTHIKNRQDMATGGYIIQISLVDESGTNYRAEIPENLPLYKEWYLVVMGAHMASRMGSSLWLVDVKLKPGTVEVDTAIQPVMEIHDQNSVFVPKRFKTRVINRRDLE